jgi:hypothetical protein
VLPHPWHRPAARLHLSEDDNNESGSDRKDEGRDRDRGKNRGRGSGTDRENGRGSRREKGKGRDRPGKGQRERGARSGAKMAAETIKGKTRVATSTDGLTSADCVRVPASAELSETKACERSFAEVSTPVRVRRIPKSLLNLVGVSSFATAQETCTWISGDPLQPASRVRAF